MMKELITLMLVIMLAVVVNVSAQEKTVVTLSGTNPGVFDTPAFAHDNWMDAGGFFAAGGAVAWLKQGELSPMAKTGVYKSLDINNLTEEDMGLLAFATIENADWLARA